MPKKKLTAEQRSELGRLLSSLRKTHGGPPLKKDRCPCGAMTAKRAKTLYHKCSAPEVAA